MSKFCMGCMEQYDDTLHICPFCGYAENTKEENALHIQPGEIIHGQYIIGRVIGFGGFGVTYIGWDALLERKVAIKEYMPSEFSTRAMGTKEITVFGGKKTEQFNGGLKRFHEEARKLAKFNTDDGIVRVYDTFEENNTAYIIMELLKGETLTAYLEQHDKVPFEKAAEMIIPIASAMQSVHQAGVIHRDIAPDNIFLTEDGKVKLIDFGAARFATTSHSRSLTVLIKPGYSPEEQYRSHGDQGPYTDVYAMGAVMYRMITGQRPPDALERRAFFEKKRKDILLPISRFVKDLPQSKQNAIYNAMNIQTEDRTQTAEEFIKELTTDGYVKRKKSKLKPIQPTTWPVWAKITFPVTAFLILVISVLMLTGIIRFQNKIQTAVSIPEGMSRVPSVVNTALDNAEERITDAALLYHISGKEYSNLIPADLILTQSLQAGSVVTQNSMIEFVISGGAETASVPGVYGMYVSEASEILEAAGFLYSITYEYSNTVAENGIISQSVAPDDECALGSEIQLVVSRGRSPETPVSDAVTEVPDFTGQTYEQVLAIAEQAQVTIIINARSYSSQFEKGTIISQNPETGSQIKSGSLIELTVSLGMETIKIPDMQFKTEEEAMKMIEANGLKASVVYEISENVKAGLVISQSPESGTESKPGSTVSLVISKGGAAFSMPDVTGMQEEAAKQALNAKGLSVTVSYEYSATEIDKVLAQSITAGTSVSAGESVVLTVGTNAEFVTVADVSGMTFSEAETKLKAQGFSVSQSGQVYHDSIAAGCVAEQNPSAGSSHKKGAVVMLSISKGAESIEVPDVRNKSESVAKSILSETGFSVSVTQEYSSAVLAGAVISQSPAPGSSLRKGSAVALVVSMGEESQNIVTVQEDPNIQTEAPAAAAPQLNLELKSVVLNPSQTYVLKYTANSSAVSWNISNPGVVRFDSSSGVITPLASGESDITASLSSGGSTVTQTCHVTVQESPYVTLSAGEVSLNIGESYSLSSQYGGSNVLTYTDSQGTGSVNSDDFTVNYASSDNRVASVSQDGVITAADGGSAVIICTVNGVSASCTVNVRNIVSGNCGDNMTWTLNRDTGELSITGTGHMDNYSSDDYPWKGSYRNDIRTVIIGNGISHLGNYAFDGCSNLSSVTIGSLDEIAQSAFRYCTSLTSVTLPASVGIIQNEAFYGCTALNAVTIENTNCEIRDPRDWYMTEYTIPEGAVIYGYSNSTAQKYAQEYQYQFSALG